MLKKKVYMIGERPEIVLYGDVGPVFAATELIPADDQSVEPVKDAVRIFFFGGTAANNIPVELPPTARTVFEGGDVHLADDGALRFGSWFGRAHTVVHHGRKAAVIVVPGLKRLNKDFISRHLFRPILDELLCRNGYVPLHAAGVAMSTYGDGGCIIVGPAGSGKTNLMYGLVGNGFYFLADDRVFLKKYTMEDMNDKPDTPVMIHSFPEYIRLASAPWKPKRLVIPPCSPIQSARVKYVLFLQRGKPGQKAALLPVSAAEAAARLLHFVSPNTDEAVQQLAFEFIGDISEYGKAYQLSGWGNPRHWIDLVCRLFQDGK